MLKRIKEHISSPDKLTDQIMQPFNVFFHKEVSGSILLLAATLVAITWANSPFASYYYSFCNTEVSVVLGDYHLSKSFRHWIDEGLMALFFFTVGLEIKREMLVGELASLKKAFLPVAAAIGGMIVPAIIYFTFTQGTPSVRGWGIPMATDIAFALGAIAVVGKRIPLSLRVFLSAFAIADDLGAVFVIAIFYTKEIVGYYLVISSFIVIGLALANFLWIRWTLLYVLLGIALWFAVVASGLHATVAGIVVAMFIPAKGKYDTDKFIQEVSKHMGDFKCPTDGCGFSILLNTEHLNAVQSIEHACHNVETPLQRLENSLHPWVAFVIIPLFAFANAGLTFSGMDIMKALTDPLTTGISAGLLFGKPIGIVLLSYLSVKTKMASLPSGVNWSHIIGTGILGGIGFTMSLFVSGLSLSTPEMLEYSKLGILTGSILSGLIGIAFLIIVPARTKGNEHVT